jgi:hypothetical protein
MDYLIPLNQSNNFPLIDDDWPNNCDKQINIQKYKHLLYNFTFCHDFYIGIDIKNVIDKYNRRIDRFNMIMKDQNITKIILYIGKKIYDEELDNVLKTLGFTNFKIKSKLYSEINKSSDWKRDNFDWVKWLHN